MSTSSKPAIIRINSSSDGNHEDYYFNRKDSPVKITNLKNNSMPKIVSTRSIKRGELLYCEIPIFSSQNSIMHNLNIDSDDHIKIRNIMKLETTDDISKVLEPSDQIQRGEILEYDIDAERNWRLKVSEKVNSIKTNSMMGTFTKDIIKDFYKIDQRKNIRTKKKISIKEPLFKAPLRKTKEFINLLNSEKLTDSQIDELYRDRFISKQKSTTVAGAKTLIKSKPKDYVLEITPVFGKETKAVKLASILKIFKENYNMTEEAPLSHNESNDVHRLFKEIHAIHHDFIDLDITGMLQVASIVKYYAFIIRGMYRKAAIDLGIYQYSSFLKHNFESPNASIFFGDSCDMYIYAEKNIEAGQLIQPCFYFEFLKSPSDILPITTTNVFASFPKHLLATELQRIFPIRYVSKEQVGRDSKTDKRAKNRTIDVLQLNTIHLFALINSSLVLFVRFSANMPVTSDNDDLKNVFSGYITIIQHDYFNNHCFDGKDPEEFEKHPFKITKNDRWLNNAIIYELFIIMLCHFIWILPVDLEKNIFKLYHWRIIYEFLHSNIITARQNPERDVSMTTKVHMVLILETAFLCRCRIVKLSKNNVSVFSNFDDSQAASHVYCFLNSVNYEFVKHSDSVKKFQLQLVNHTLNNELEDNMLKSLNNNKIKNINNNDSSSTTSSSSLTESFFSSSDGEDDVVDD